MFTEKLQNKKNFDNNGFVVLDTKLNSNSNFITIVNEIYKEIDFLISKQEYKEYGGYMMGNFGINQGPLGKKLYNIVFQEELLNLIEILTEKKIDNFYINYGGNLTLPGKGLQHFHMDGEFKQEMYLVSIATENINLMNGPTEICVGTHSKNLSYWDFFFTKKNKKKVTINKGQILIRKHNLWHRGTANTTDKYRLLLSFILIPTIKKNQYIPISDKLEMVPNFFKSNFFGRIQEFSYVHLRFFYIIVKLAKSFFLR